MAQLHAARSVIETISTAMADLAQHVTSDSRARKGDTDSSAMASAKKNSANKERHRRAQQANSAAEMVEDAAADLFNATALAELEPCTSMNDLKTITASQNTLLGFARSRRTRGLTAVEYARYAGLCFALIRDVNDFMGRVIQMELDSVRLRHHDALLHSDQRPTTASQTSNTSASSSSSSSNDATSVYGGGDALSSLFGGGDLLPPLTPYQTPPVSGPSSRASSPPPLSDDDVDLMGD